jgi:hypothetical protein
MHDLHQNGGAYIYEFLLFALIFSSSCLVLENHIVVPPPLNVEVWLVQQGISTRYVTLTGFLLGCFSLSLL